MIYKQKIISISIRISMSITVKLEKQEEISIIGAGL